MTRVSRTQHYDTTADPACARIRRLTAAWIGLLVLVFNIAGGGLLPTRPASAAATPFAQSLTDGRIVICTATGLVVMDRDGTVISTGDQPGGSDLCVFCLPMLHGTAMTAVPPVLLLRAVPPAPLPQPQVIAPPLRAAGLNLTTAPRGPPPA